MITFKFQEYVNQSDFEDWIYDNFTGDFEIDFDSEIEWISDTAFTRKVKGNEKVKPETVELTSFDPYQYEHCGGKVTIAVDETGLITVTGTKFIRLHEKFVARIYVDRMYGRGINGVSGVYYDIPVNEPEKFYEYLNTSKFIKSVDILDSHMTKEYAGLRVSINVDHISDIHMYSYITYVDEVNVKK